MIIGSLKLKWRIVTGAVVVLVLVVGVVQFKQEETVPTASIENDSSKALTAAEKQVQGGSNKARAIQRQQHDQEPAVKWVKSDEALKHRAAAKLEIEKKLNQSRGEPKSSHESSSAVRKTTQPVSPGAFYAYVPPPPGREGFGQWVAKPIPESEITEKRQRLARGERLFERVIVRSKEISPAEASGGMREVVIP